jgi:uncharacterized protein (TIGR02186 family)
MRVLLAALAALLALAAPTAAQDADAEPAISAALINDFVAVTSSFTGAKLTLFGATRTRQGKAGDVVVVVRGPDRPAVVTLRSRVMGMWLGRSTARFANAPGFLAIASTRPLEEIATERTLRGWGLLPEALIAPAPQDADRADIERYAEALIRLRREEGLYAVNPAGVRRLSGGLFRADVSAPDSTPPGIYTVRVLLFRNGAPAATVSSTVLITHEGIERFVLDAARRHSWAYGLAAILMAALAGWLANIAFARLRGA